MAFKSWFTLACGGNTLGTIFFVKKPYMYIKILKKHFLQNVLNHKTVMIHNWLVLKLQDDIRVQFK